MVRSLGSSLPSLIVKLVILYCHLANAYAKSQFGCPLGRYFDEDVNNCEACIDICDPGRGTMDQCKKHKDQCLTGAEVSSTGRTTFESMVIGNTEDLPQQQPDYLVVYVIIITTSSIVVFIALFTSLLVYLNKRKQLFFNKKKTFVAHPVDERNTRVHTSKSHNALHIQISGSGSICKHCNVLRKVDPIFQDRITSTASAAALSSAANSGLELLSSV